MSVVTSDGKAELDVLEELLSPSPPPPPHELSAISAMNEINNRIFFLCYSSFLKSFFEKLRTFLRS